MIGSWDGTANRAVWLIGAIPPSLSLFSCSSLIQQDSIDIELKCPCGEEMGGG